VRATVASVIPLAGQGADSPMVRAHQKFLAGDGNHRLLHYIRAEYRGPVDFVDFKPGPGDAGGGIACRRHECRGVCPCWRPVPGYRRLRKLFTKFH